MPVTAFLKNEVIARGSREEVAAVLRRVEPPSRSSDLLVFDDESGRQVDLDLREPATAPRGRGRPSLGVKAKEITLLPRHWEWLKDRRGGASAELRRLVEQAMREGRGAAERHDTAYRFLSAMAGDRPKFEDAVREIYAGNKVGYDHFTHGWPEAVRDHGRMLAFAE